MDAATLLAALATILPPGVAGYLTVAVTTAFILSGAVAQIAALFGLDGVAKFSTSLHTALVTLAGNYGKAANASASAPAQNPVIPPGASAP